MQSLHHLSALNRAIELVSQHHGLPASVGESEEAASRLKVAAFARRRHLRVKRRIVRLEEIPEAQFPVILETHSGRRCVIVTAKHPDGDYSVQFPDSRESLVSGDRLRESYSGHCLFLRPKRSSRHDDSNGGRLSFARRLRHLLRSAKLSRGAFGFNLVVLGATLLLVASNREAMNGVFERSLLIPLLASGFAAAALAGVIGLRRELFRRRLAAGWVDLAFVPVLFGTAITFAGWPIVPLLGLGLLLILGSILSRRLGSVRSQLQKHWRLVVVGAFFVGALSLSLSYAAGNLDMVLMNAALGLGTYAIYLIAQASTCWQTMRLSFSL